MKMISQICWFYKVPVTMQMFVVVYQQSSFENSQSKYDKAVVDFLSGVFLCSPPAPLMIDFSLLEYELFEWSV